MATILCVEDQDFLRQSIADELTDSGYDTITASDGREGLELAVKHKPDLILSDISMPNMNGIAFLRELRGNHAEFSEVPFILLSALADKNEVMEGLRLGADDYLTKPADLDLIVSKVEASLRQAGRFIGQRMAENAKLQETATTMIRQRDRRNAQLKASLTKLVEQVESAHVAGRPADAIAGPKTNGPRDIVIVGKGAKPLFELQKLLDTSGHNVTVYTSGRAYLADLDRHRPALTLIWSETDDLPADRVMRQHPFRIGSYVLVEQTKPAAQMPEIPETLFDARLRLPLAAERLYESIARFL